MTLTPETQAVCALDRQRVELYADALNVSKRQHALSAESQAAMRKLSVEHEVILAKIDAVGDAILAITGGLPC